jgi:glycosyltransferase involved in cell wall biosynthesis
MKIAVIDPSNFTPYRNFSLCAGLEKTGHDITLFTSRFIYDPSLDFSKLNSTNYFFFRFSNKMIQHSPYIRTLKIFKLIKGIEYCSDLFRLLNYMKRHKFTIANIEWTLIPQIDFHFIRLLKKNGIKTVLTAHNLPSHPVYNGKNTWRRFMGKIYSEVELLVPLTETTKEIFVKETKIRSEKVRAVYHGNFEIFRTGQYKTSYQARKELEIPQDSDVILFFGIIWHYKGLEYLLKALQIVKSRNQNIKLLIAGKLFTSKEKLYEHEKFRELQKYLIVHANFIPMNEVEKYFIASDVVIMPHVHNLHSGQHHLAYTFGRPVIATACGDSLEIVREGKSGFLVPPENEQALAEAIINFFNLEKAKREEMNHYCRYLSDRNSWDKVAHNLIRTFREYFRIS